MVNHRRVLIAIITVLVIAVMLFGSSGLAVIALAAAGVMTITDLNGQQVAENNKCLASGAASGVASLEAPPANTPVLPLEALPAGMYGSTLESPLKNYYNGGDESKMEASIRSAFNNVIQISPGNKEDAFISVDKLSWLWYTGSDNKIISLSLDGFSQTHKLAFEYQGPRHYHYFPLLNEFNRVVTGINISLEEASKPLDDVAFDLDLLQDEADAIIDNMNDDKCCSYSKFMRHVDNDNKKKDLCIANEVKLICIPYTETDRIKAAINLKRLVIGGVEYERLFDLALNWYVASRIYDACGRKSESILLPEIFKLLETPKNIGETGGYVSAVPAPEVNYTNYKVEKMNKVFKSYINQYRISYSNPQRSDVYFQQPLVSDVYFPQPLVSDVYFQKPQGIIFYNNTRKCYIMPTILWCSTEDAILWMYHAATGKYPQNPDAVITDAEKRYPGTVKMPSGKDWLWKNSKYEWVNVYIKTLYDPRKPGLIDNPWLFVAHLTMPGKLGFVDLGNVYNTEVKMYRLTKDISNSSANNRLLNTNEMEQLSFDRQYQNTIPAGGRSILNSVSKKGLLPTPPFPLFNIQNSTTIPASVSRSSLKAKAVASSKNSLLPTPPFPPSNIQQPASVSRLLPTAKAFASNISLLPPPPFPPSNIQQSASVSSLSPKAPAFAIKGAEVVRDPLLPVTGSPTHPTVNGPIPLVKPPPPFPPSNIQQPASVSRLSPTAKAFAIKGAEVVQNPLLPVSGSPTHPTVNGPNSLVKPPPVLSVASSTNNGPNSRVKPPPMLSAASSTNNGSKTFVFKPPMPPVASNINNANSSLEQKTIVRSISTA